MSAKRTIAGITFLLLLAGCTPAGGGTATERTAAATPIAPAADAVDDEVTAVSVSSPVGLAVEGVPACGVEKYQDQIVGIAVVAHASLLPHYVPLTGDEPEVKSEEPAFVVLYTGTIRLPLRGEASYADATGATCIYLEGHPMWFGTGPWLNSLGNKGDPLPAPLMDRVLPEPLP